MSQGLFFGTLLLQFGSALHFGVEIRERLLTDDFAAAAALGSAQAGFYLMLAGLNFRQSRKALAGVCLFGLLLVDLPGVHNLYRALASQAYDTPAVLILLALSNAALALPIFVKGWVDFRAERMREIDPPKVDKYRELLK